MRNLRWLIALVVAGLLLGAGPVRAQTSYPMITSVYPVAIPRGQTTEVTVTIGPGNLYGAYRVLFQGRGIQAELPPAAPAADGQQPPRVNRLQMKVTVAADAALGPREFRLASRSGLSSIGLLVIDDDPLLLEKEPNNTREQAQEVRLPVSINGILQAAEDVDTYRLNVKAGEQLAFSVISARLQDKIHDLAPGSGGTHSDPILSLVDATGRELAVSNDYYRADDLLVYRFEQAGEYFVQVRDVRYSGHPTWTYRLLVTPRPYLTAVFPMAAPRGATLEVQPVGYNLGGMQKAQVTVPAEMPPGPMDLRLSAGGALTNPVPFIASDLPEVVESAGTERLESAMPLRLPCGVSGRIREPLEEDHYRFEAKAGEKWTFEIEARRYDSMLDSVLAVLDTQGKILASNDDAVGKDSKLNWTAPAPGAYFLRVTDLHSRGGENYVYHLTARPTLPDFTLQVDGDKAQIGPGGSTVWYALLTRTGGFQGPVELHVTGLPEGVIATCATIPASMTQGSIILTAAPGAKIDCANVRVFGRATVPGPDGQPQTIERDAEPLQEIYTPGGGRAHYPVALQSVAVTDPADIELTADRTEVTLKPGESVRINVQVKRHPSYQRGVVLDVALRHLSTVYANPLPPGVTLDEGNSKTLLGEKDTQGWITLKAAPDATPVENLPIAIMGYVSINFVVKVGHSTAPIRLTVAPK